MHLRLDSLRGMHQSGAYRGVHLDDEAIRLLLFLRELEFPQEGGSVHLRRTIPEPTQVFIYPFPLFPLIPHPIYQPPFPTRST